MNRLFGSAATIFSLALIASSLIGFNASALVTGTFDCVSTSSQSLLPENVNVTVYPTESLILAFSNGDQSVSSAVPPSNLTKIIKSYELSPYGAQDDTTMNFTSATATFDKNGELTKIIVTSTVTNADNSKTAAAATYSYYTLQNG